MLASRLCLLRNDCHSLRLCCTNRVLKDSLPESSMLSDCYEQLDTDDVQDPELGGVQPFAKEQGIAFDLV